MTGFSPLALVTALLAVVLVVLALSYAWSPLRQADYVACPKCRKAIQKSRHVCPFCQAIVKR